MWIFDPLTWYKLWDTEKLKKGKKKDFCTFKDNKKWNHSELPNEYVRMIFCLNIKTYKTGACFILPQLTSVASVKLLWSLDVSNINGALFKMSVCAHFQCQLNELHKNSNRAVSVLTSRGVSIRYWHFSAASYIANLQKGALLWGWRTWLGHILKTKEKGSLCNRLWARPSLIWGAVCIHGNCMIYIVCFHLPGWKIILDRGVGGRGWAYGIVHFSSFPFRSISTVTCRALQLLSQTSER